MLANWGYQDGSGAYFITIDTDKCDGCRKCLDACPGGVFEVGEDPADPLREEPMYTKRESELLQQFMQQHGKMPEGNAGIEEELF